MTIEEKAKAYDEALKKAKDMLSYKEVRREDMEYLFPELKESEDERIRKALIVYLRSILSNKKYGDKFIESWIDWLEKQGKNNMGISEATKQELEDSLHKALEKETSESCNEFLEKQGEQKPFDYENANIQQKDFAPKSALEAAKEEKVNNQNCIKSTDKVESKFKVKDWIVRDCDGFTVSIESVRDGIYYFNEGGKLPVKSVDDIYHLWTIQDAKDGDVLYTSSTASNEVFIFKGLTIEGYIECYCSYDSEDKYREGKYHFIGKPTFMTHPATKEQRDLLFQKMHEAGYEWDAEKKELRKIEQKPVVEMITPEESLGVDSDTYNKIVDECIYGEQKPAWSEDDEEIIIQIKDAVEDYFPTPVADKIKSRLKSLRPQNHWKPSDEQMDAINDAIDYLGGNTKIVRKHLMSLYEQLKKLKA